MRRMISIPNKLATQKIGVAFMLVFRSARLINNH